MSRDDDEAGRALAEGLFVLPVHDRARGLLGHPLDSRFAPLDTAKLQRVVDELVPRVDLTGITCVLGVPEGGRIGRAARRPRIPRGCVQRGGQATPA